jgi:hypothetical protein
VSSAPSSGGSSAGTAGRRPPIVAHSELLGGGYEQHGGDDPDHRADEVELEDVAFADRAGDDTAHDRAGDAEEDRREHPDVLTPG